MDQEIPFQGSRNPVLWIKKYRSKDQVSGGQNAFPFSSSAGEESFNKEDYFDNIGLLLLSWGLGGTRVDRGISLIPRGG